MEKANKKDQFTFIPRRNREIPEKRFARWTTNVRPINFFKTWDTTFSPSSGTGPVEPDSPKCFSQPAPQSRQQNQSISLHRDTTNVVDKENSETSHLPGKNSDENDCENAQPKQSQSVVSDKESIVYREETDISRKDKSANLDNLVGKIQERRKSLGLSENRNRSTNKYLSVNNTTNVDKSDKNCSKNVSKHHEGSTCSIQERPMQSEIKTSDQNSYNISSNDERSGVQEQNSKGKKNTKGGEMVSETLPKSGESSVIESENLISSDNNQEHTKSVPNAGQLLQEEEGKDLHNGDESNNFQEAEEIDITHKIPLAQSTAIGIEIEQDFDDNEDDEAENEINREKDQQRTESNVSEGDGIENTEQPTDKQMLKRKLTLSTPKRNPPSTLKKRKIAITGPIKVQNILHRPLVGEEVQPIEETENNEISKNGEKSKNSTDDSAKKKPSTRRHSLTFNPSQPGPSSVSGSKSKPEKTPDLRKAMLLSYAHQTPSGVTPGYIAATPVSGPITRPTQKRRVTKVPAPIEIASDASQTVEEVRLWKSDGEARRKSSDITDLDVILQTFEQGAWHFKENIESGPIRKAVMLCAKKTQNDMRNLIAMSQRLKHLNTSYLKSRSIIKKRKADLLAMKQKYIRFKGELASLKLEHDATVTKSQRCTEALAFQQAIKDCRKELQNSLKKSDKSKKDKQLIGPKLEDHRTLCKESRDQLEKIQSQRLKIFQRHFTKMSY